MSWIKPYKERERKRGGKRAREGVNEKRKEREKKVKEKKSVGHDQ